MQVVRKGEATTDALYAVALTLVVVGSVLVLGYQQLTRMLDPDRPLSDTRDEWSTKR